MNKKQKAFADEYLSNGFNGSLAYMSAYPKSKYTSARANAVRLLTNDSIKDYISAQIAEKVMGRDEVLMLLSKRARNETDKEQLKALELIGKTHSLFTDRIEGSLNHTVSWADFVNSDAQTSHE